MLERWLPAVFLDKSDFEYYVLPKEQGLASLAYQLNDGGKKPSMVVVNTMMLNLK